MTQRKGLSGMCYGLSDPFCHLSGWMAEHRPHRHLCPCVLQQPFLSEKRMVLMEGSEQRAILWPRLLIRGWLCLLMSNMSQRGNEKPEFYWSIDGWCSWRGSVSSWDSDFHWGFVWFFQEGVLCVSLRLAITWTFSSMSHWRMERVLIAQSLPSSHTEGLFLHVRMYTCVRAREIIII